MSGSSPVVADGLLASWQIAPDTLEEGTDYLWRVRSTGASSDQVWSGWEVFMIQAAEGGSTISAPSEASDSDGTVTQWSDTETQPAAGYDTLPSADGTVIAPLDGSDGTDPMEATYSLPKTGTSHPDGYHIDFAYAFHIPAKTPYVCIDPFKGTLGTKPDKRVRLYFNLWNDGAFGAAYTDGRTEGYFGLDGQWKYFCWPGPFPEAVFGDAFKVGWTTMTNVPSNKAGTKAIVHYTEKTES